MSVRTMPVQTKAQVLALLQEYHQDLHRFGIKRCGVLGSFVRDTAIHCQTVARLVESKQDAIEWRAMAGMRDRLIHNYFGIDYDIVWDVVVNKIPALDAEIRLILKQEYP